MPQITVWCLPPDISEDRLRELHKAIVGAVASVEEIGLKNESDMLVVFPPDMMKYGAGSEIMIQVSELWDRPERTPHVRGLLTESLGMAVKEMFPKSKVTARCDPPFDPNRDGFWMSRD